MRSERGDVGETLIEILLTVFLTGLTITALLSSMAAAGNAGNAQRSSVQVDMIMRNYAEATKAAVELCVTDGIVTVVAPPEPTGFVTVVAPTVPTGLADSKDFNLQCPAVDAALKLDLTVTGPLGITETMELWVRTP